MNRALPGIAELTGYRLPLLRGDAVAGVTVAAYVVPQVMAYSAVAGLPPVVGLAILRLWPSTPHPTLADAVGRPGVGHGLLTATTSRCW